MGNSFYSKHMRNKYIYAYQNVLFWINSINNLLIFFKNRLAMILYHKIPMDFCLLKCIEYQKNKLHVYTKHY